MVHKPPRLCKTFVSTKAPLHSQDLINHSHTPSLLSFISPLWDVTLESMGLGIITESSVLLMREGEGRLPKDTIKDHREGTWT